MKLLLFILLEIGIVIPLLSKNKAQAYGFCLGDWEVSWVGSKSKMVKVSNEISKVLNGQVFQDDYFDPSRNFKGRSLSVYNSQAVTWHQTWVDNQGGL